MNADDHYLYKLKVAGMSDQKIARRLSTSEQEIARRWVRILEEVREQQASGYNQLCDFFTNMCKQYELLGESLKVMGGAIGTIMPPENIRAMIDPDPEKTVQNLRTRALVLFPFVIDPAFPPPIETPHENPAQN